MARKIRVDCENNSGDKSPHSLDFKEIIQKKLKKFFEGKCFYDSRPISEKDLFLEDNYSLIMRTPFDDETFKFIHKHCLSEIPKQNWYRDCTVSWGVHYLLGIIKELKEINVPKEMQPGFILLFFKICKGINVLPPPLI